MAITIEIKKNSGSWVDYSAYIRPGVIREDVEEELTAFRCGDVTCQFQNFAGMFITAVGTGLFDGWTADDIFYIRIALDSEYHFGGFIHYASLSYNDKTKLGEFTAFSYLKDLENYSAENVQRDELSLTLAENAAEGDEFIEVDEDISDVAKGDVFNIYTTDYVPERSEEKTVKYTDTTNKKIYFTKDLENGYNGGNAYAELKTRQYKNKTISWLVEQVAAEAGYDLAHLNKSILTSFETSHLNCHPATADGVTGRLISIVGRATGGDYPNIVTDDGTFEGEWGGLFTLTSATAKREWDFLNEGYLSPTPFTARFQLPDSDYPIEAELMRYAYSYNLSKRWYTTGTQGGTMTVKSQDWNDVSKAWENEQTIDTFTGFSTYISYDRRNGFVYLGQGASPNTDRMYYLRLSDNTIQYFSGLTFYVKLIYLYHADTLCSIDTLLGKLKRFRYTGGSMTYLGEVDYPKGAIPSTLCSITDAGHTEFNKVFCLAWQGGFGSGGLYLWYCGHDFTSPIYELITEFNRGPDHYVTMTYEDGAIYVGTWSTVNGLEFFEINKTRSLTVADANFANMTCAEALSLLAIAGRAVVKVKHTGILYFYDRVSYIDLSGTDISSLIDESRTRNWMSRIDGVRVKWWKGQEIYPSWATGEIVDINCELIDTMSFATDTAYYYYRIFNPMRKRKEVELQLQALQLLNWVVIGTENWIIYGIEKDLIDRKMKFNLREKFVEAVS